MVKVIGGKWKKLEKLMQGKEIYCFGSGKKFESTITMLPHNICKNIVAVIDNDTKKQGTKKYVNEIEIPIISMEQCLQQKNAEIVFIVTTIHYSEILQQLDRIPLLDNALCLIDQFYEVEEDTYKVKTKKSGQYYIPAKIHYCWFGETEIPEQFKTYMKSWKKFCPGYEIIRWDETNYDVEKNRYMNEAYQEKKWGFVPDYARLDIIYREGGIYLDTDVEIVKSLDNLRYNKMYCGFERNGKVALGLGFGAQKGNRVIKEMMDYYDGKSFYLKSGELDLTPSPVIQTQYLQSKGLKRDGLYQELEDATIYPTTFFAPSDETNNVSKDTYSIHHYAGTWLDALQIERKKEEERNAEILKKRIYIV